MKRCHHLRSLLPIWFSLVILFLNSHISNGDNVTYDHRALVINGVRRVLISGSIHYPRSTPEVNLNTNYTNDFFVFCFFSCHFGFSWDEILDWKCGVQMWPDLIQKAKDGGLDIVETYVFWNLHEPVRGQVFFAI